MHHPITDSSIVRRRRSAFTHFGGIATVAACMLALVVSDANGEETPPRKIEPDRRDFTTGTGIVEAGRVQLELGVSGERGDGERLVSIGGARFVSRWDRTSSCASTCRHS